MLDSRPDTFDERNLFLHALLGMLSACQRLDEAVAVPAPGEEEPAAADDPWLLCVLGAVAFRLRLGAIVRDVLPADGPPDVDPGCASSSAAPAAGPSLREMLR